MNKVKEELRPQVDEIVAMCEDRGYDVKASYVYKKCCGPIWNIDFNYLQKSGYEFRISVKPERIEIPRLMFSGLIISHARFYDNQQLMDFIDHCEALNITNRGVE